MGSLYDPTKQTSYIMEVDANNLYGWAMSQEMPDGEFEWVSQDECRTMEQTLNFADGRIAMFDLGIFDHRVFDEKKSFILEVDLEYPPELHERDDDYPLAPEVMTIEPEITGEKQHNLRAQYFGAACPFSRKLICSFLRGARSTSPVLPGPRNEAGESPPRNPLQLVALCRQLHRE